MMTMTANQEISKYALCLIPIREVSPERPKWVQILDEEGTQGDLTLVDAGGENDFYKGYAFILHPGFIEIGLTDRLPGIRKEVFIKEDSRRVKERTPVILLKEGELTIFQEALLEYTDRLPSELNEGWKKMYKTCKTGVKEFFELIIWNTMSRLYKSDGKNARFQYWKLLVCHDFVPYMIDENIWERWEQYAGHDREYTSGGGYVGIQEFNYSFYGTEQSRACNGIRDVGRYVREQTNGLMNESRVKDFLCTVNPLECSRYVCGVKISNRFTANNGGCGGGNIYQFLYDKEAVYQGMREAEEEGREF